MSVVPGPNRRTFLAALAAAACTPRTPASQRPGAASSAPLVPATEPVPSDGAINLETLAEAEKLFGVHYSGAERAQVLTTLEDQLTRTLALRQVELPNDLAPATVFDPRVPGRSHGPIASAALGFRPPSLPLPGRDEDIAFAPLTHLAGWIARKKISSTRLTELYLDRLETHGRQLQCVIELLTESALEQARRADQEIARGNYRGPLHGVPWGAKDLLDTQGVATTWGATPYRDRIPESNAVVVQRLHDAGAVLVAKLSMGALAYGDIWFDGVTRNPWDPREGSSGSSAGSAAAAAAGLVAFALGTETYGSIVSPSMRCGTTGLRPTFGRVPRTGAMALCWSLDKIGPIARTVHDCALVLAAIQGVDAGDPSSLAVPLDIELSRSPENPRIGYDPAWFESEDATETDRRALAVARDFGLPLVPIELPKWPYSSLLSILEVEAAAAFETMTLDDLDDRLRWQEPEAWPNTFRSARFISAIEYVQAQRFRRRLMNALDEQFQRVDMILSPSFANDLLLVTNFTGHPCITFRAGFERRPVRPFFDPDAPTTAAEDREPVPREVPHGVTLWGRLFEEGALVRLAHRFEQKLAVWDRRPTLLRVQAAPRPTSANGSQAAPRSTRVRD